MPVQMISLFMCFWAISHAIPNNNALSMLLLLVHYIFVQVIINWVDHALYLEMKSNSTQHDVW